MALKAIRRVLPAVLAAVSYAGQPTDSAGSLPDPCSLLSSAEVEGAAGLPVTEGRIGVRGRSTTSCSFAGKADGRIAVFIRRAGAEWSAEQAQRMHRGVGYREVGTVGERAFFLDRNGSGAVLCVFQQPYYLQVSLVGARLRAGGLERLAEVALRRLAGEGQVAAVRR